LATWRLAHFVSADGLCATGPYVFGSGSIDHVLITVKNATKRHSAPIQTAQGLLVPPPCMIPGQGTCPYNSQCVFDSCATDASGGALVCSCSSGGSASCYTTSCSGLLEGGVASVDAGDAGVTCLLEGYYSCSAGSWCQLGNCADGTPYGCTCNADGTASCRLTCPNPAACTIPGEGTCPFGSSCLFGSCNGSSGTLLSCYCNAGGSAYCNTISCADAGSDGN
jgi:hypothetical protein